MELQTDTLPLYWDREFFVDNATEMKVYRIALPPALIDNPCSLNTTLPSPDCYPLSFILNMTIMFGQIVFGPKTRYEVIMATGWSFHSNVSEPDDYSVMGLLENGLADISAPIAFLLESRIRRVNYSMAVQYESLCFVHRRLSPTGKTLSVHTLLTGPQGIWITIALCFLAQRLIVHSLRHPHTQMVQVRVVVMVEGTGEVVESRRERYRARSVWTRLESRVSVLTSLFLGISLALLANYLFMIFQGIKKEKVHWVRSADDLINGMLDGTVVTVLDSSAYIPLLRQAYTGTLQQFKEAVRKSPPLLVTDPESSISSFAASNTLNSPLHVLVAESLLPFLLDLQNERETFDTYCNEESQHQVLNGVYYGRNLHPPSISINQLGVFQAMGARLRRVYFPFSDSLVLEPADDRRYVMNFGQIFGLVYLFLLAASTALFLFCLETLYHKSHALLEKTCQNILAAGSLRESVV